MEESVRLVKVEAYVGDNYYTIKEARAIELYTLEEQARIEKVIGEEREAYVQEVAYDRAFKQQNCTKCGHQEGTWLGLAKWRWVWYAEAAGAPLVLGFQAGRWQCQRCDTSYTDYPLSVMAYSRHSVVMLYEMLEAMRKQSMAWVCRRYHIDEKTLSRMLLRQVEIRPDWEALARQSALHLVVDEHSFAGKKLVITVCEAVTRQVLAILRDAKIATLKAFLKSIPRAVKKRIVYAATDLKEGYRTTLLGWKRSLIVSADPFHVVRLGNQLVEEERRMLQADLRLKDREAHIPTGPLRAGGERIKRSTRSLRNEILAAHPTLECTYRLKEQLRAVYLARDPVQSPLLFERFEEDLRHAIDNPALRSIRKDLKRFEGTLRRWRPHILAYFNTWLSTAIVEGFHTPIKLIKRISFGFRNVERYRAKIMLGLGSTIIIHRRPQQPLAA